MSRGRQNSGAYRGIENPERDAARPATTRMYASKKIPRADPRGEFAVEIPSFFSEWLPCQREAIAFQERENAVLARQVKRAESREDRAF